MQVLLALIPLAIAAVGFGISHEAKESAARSSYNRSIERSSASAAASEAEIARLKAELERVKLEEANLRLAEKQSEAKSKKLTAAPESSTAVVSNQRSTGQAR